MSEKRIKAFFAVLWFIGMTSLQGCGTPLVNNGLRAEYPRQRFFLFWDDAPAGFVTVDSLQPTLKWEPFPQKKEPGSEFKSNGQVRDVIYQLRMASEGWFYAKDDLKEPWHKIEVPLKASTRYLWTVRACFKLDGEPRCTIWGSVSDFEYWSYHHPNGSSYRFKTPAQK